MSASSQAKPARKKRDGSALAGHSVPRSRCRGLASLGLAVHGSLRSPFTIRDPPAGRVSLCAVRDSRERSEREVGRGTTSGVLRPGIEPEPDGRSHSVRVLRLAGFNSRGDFTAHCRSQEMLAGHFVPRSRCQGLTTFGLAVHGSLRSPFTIRDPPAGRVSLCAVRELNPG